VELRLERPEARNAIGKEMLRGLRSAMDKVEADPTANVLLVASSVPKIFCAGADLKVPARLIAASFSYRIFFFQLVILDPVDQYAYSVSDQIGSRLRDIALL
jgi:enoyl-CoA hydratase/carnithine racemase